MYFLNNITVVLYLQTMTDTNWWPCLDTKWWPFGSDEL